MYAHVCVRFFQENTNENTNNYVRTYLALADISCSCFSFLLDKSSFVRHILHFWIFCLTHRSIAVDISGYVGHNNRVYVRVGYLKLVTDYTGV